MHEHISNQLSKIEIRRQEEMQAKRVIQINAVSFGYLIAEETQDVYNKQVFRNRR